MAIAVFLSALGTARADSVSDRFTRIRKNAAGVPQAVETSIASYERNGVRVDLISAIHVGEKRYYAELNQAFAGYDGVLYELIAPDGFKFTKDRKDSAVSSVQRKLQELLDLDYQLDQVDYNRPNFIHADVSPDEFFAALASSNFSLFETLNTLLAASGAQRQKRDPIQDLKAFVVMFQARSTTRTYELRTYLAEQFHDADELVKRLEGVIGDAIVAKRNSRALEVLDREIHQGKKHLAIFYGAAHMPDMERRLMEQRHFERREVRWLCAWSLQPDSGGDCPGLALAASPGTLPTP